jgi:AraC-like DNA-binding protein
MTHLPEQKWPGNNLSFITGIYQDDMVKSTWHYHDNYELSFVTKGAGKRIVADSIVNFYPGDMVFIGRKLPHVWIADKEYQVTPDRSLELVYLQFTSDVMTPSILDLPEFRFVKRAMELSERGIQITGQTLNDVSEIMLQLPYLEEFDRLISFFKLLNVIGQSDTHIPLASEEYIKKRLEPANKRISMIHEYFLANYHKELNLSEIASLVSMAEGSLCRFFKEKAGCTPFEYLNRVKTDLACKFLLDEDMTITEVAMESGFNNLSHFNKQFKKNTGMTPSEYKKQLQALK